MVQKIALIKAGWHTRIVESAEASFIEAMGGAAQVDVIEVPGSLEVPLVGQQCLESGYDMAVGLGFIVDGAIYRHEFVARAVIDGIVNVSLKTGKPFLSVVLTAKTFSEASPENEEYFVNHFVIKGQEAADAAKAMFALTQNMKQAA